MKKYILLVVTMIIAIIGCQPVAQEAINPTEPSQIEVLTPQPTNTLCDYNDETLVTNSLVCRAQEKRHVSRISRQAR